MGKYNKKCDLETTIINYTKLHTQIYEIIKNTFAIYTTINETNLG